MNLHIGTSGWSYKHWRGGVFYPDALAVKRQLTHIGERFDTVEINRSFYSLLTPSTCAAWREATPAGFRFALKGGKFITHNKKLRDVRQALANYFAAGPLALGDKLGPIVWQLPANLTFDAARIESFFASLPRTRAQAAELAADHDERVRHGVHLQAGRNRRLRHAIEPRHESFRDPAFAALATKYEVAVAVSDAADWPRFELGTTDFMYVRLHGGQQTYASGYSGRKLSHWAERITRWREGQYDTQRARKAGDVYVYFDNDLQGHAPHDALALKALLDA